VQKRHSMNENLCVCACIHYIAYTHTLSHTHTHVHTHEHTCTVLPLTSWSASGARIIEYPLCPYFPRKILVAAKSALRLNFAANPLSLAIEVSA